METPYLKLKSTPQGAGWEEDDPTPKKTSAWDLPTPSSGTREDDHSFRMPASSWRDRQAFIFERFIGGYLGLCSTP